MHPTPTSAGTTPAVSAPVEPTVADTLRGAALYIGRHGWHQGAYYATDPTRETPFPPACAHGAISAAAYGWANPDPLDPATQCMDEARLFFSTVAYFNDYIVDIHGCAFPDDMDEASVWNDMDGRTIDEVILGLNAAATEWEVTHDPVYRRHAGHDGTQPDCPYCPPADGTGDGAR